MNEDFLIEQKFGKPQLFSVPEGYFEKLEKGIMSQIEPQGKILKHHSIRYLRIIAVAACTILAIITTVVYFNKNNSNADERVVNIPIDNMTQSVYTDYMVDELSDYAMLDNDDFYSFIADE